MSNAGDKPVVTQRARDELTALGYSVVDAHNDIVESGWLMRPPCITDRAWIAATEDEAWAAAARHREQDTLSREGREATEDLLDDYEDENIDEYMRSDSAYRVRCKRCGGDDFFKSSIEHKPGCIVGRIRTALSTPPALDERRG